MNRGLVKLVQFLLGGQCGAGHLSQEGLGERKENQSIFLEFGTCFGERVQGKGTEAFLPCSFLKGQGDIFGAVCTVPSQKPGLPNMNQMFGGRG